MYDLFLLSDPSQKFRIRLLLLFLFLLILLLFRLLLLLEFFTVNFLLFRLKFVFDLHLLTSSSWSTSTFLFLTNKKCVSFVYLLGRFLLFFLIILLIIKSWIFMGFSKFFIFLFLFLILEDIKLMRHDPKNMRIIKILLFHLFIIILRNSELDIFIRIF